MLYDRPYMREGDEPESSQATAYMTLLFVTVGVFVLQQLLNVLFPGELPYRTNRFLTDWFALSGEHFRQLKAWTPVTYAFLHSTSGLLHILGNMLGLFFLGRVLEPLLGRNRFLLLYFGGTLLGALLYLVFHYNDAFPVVGASASIFALLAFFCRLRPEQPITLLLFFVLPVTLKPKWVLWITLGVTLSGILGGELPGLLGNGPITTNIAHSAHLGGLIAGLLFHQFVHEGNGLEFLQRFQKSPAKADAEPPAWFKRRPKAARKLNYSVNRKNRDDLQAEVDRILDKINLSGFGSLTEEEKNTLDRAKEILRK
ncbi:MAG: rhomboid family intramembrane serine protease [Coraliomargarita sp.]